MIQVTESALKEINKWQDKNKDQMNDRYVRLSMSIGCGGPQLQLALEESAGKQDQIFAINGVKFLINTKANSYFHNTKIDFVRNLLGVWEFIIITV